jgi:mannosyltransferase
MNKIFDKFKTRHYIAIIVTAISIFAAVSLATINKFSLWHDESFTHLLVSDSFGEMIRRTSYDVHPPLYYVLIKGWAGIFGYSAVALRSFSFVTMLSAMILLIAYAWRKHGRGVAALSAVLLSVNPALLRYSQEMRMYGLVLLLAVASTWAFTGLLNKPSWTRKVIYGLLVAGLIYTQYFAVLIVLGHVAYWLSNKSTVKHLKSTGFKKTFLYLLKDKSVWPAFVLTGVAFLPWLPILASQAGKTQGGFWIGPASHRSVINFFTTSFGMQQEWKLEGWTASIMIVILAATSRLVYLAYKKNKLDMKYLTFTALVPIAALYALSMPPVQPYFHERYLLIVVPVLILLISLSSVRLVRSKQLLVMSVLGLLILIGAKGMWTASKLGSNFGWSDKEYFSSKSMTEWSNDKFKVGDTIVASSLWVYFDARYYQQVERGRQVFIKDSGTNKYGNNSLVYDREDIKLTDTELASLKGRVWVYDQQKPKLDIPMNWQKLDCLERGYGSLSLYQVN